MLTPSLEDYLEEAYRLSRELRRVRPKDLSLSLNVAMPSVTQALQKLAEAGLIHYRAYSDVLLTEEGEGVGQYLVHRNEILRRFLAALDVECDIAGEVEGMEHYIAPEVVMGIARLVEFMEQAENRAAFAGFAAGEGRLSEPSRFVKTLEGIKRIRRFGGKAR
ncbi:MAG: metal-dependent transcriptional regulator [Methanocella sp.]